MQLHEFIFSEERKYKLLRHISFWLAWIIFSSSVQLIPATPDSMSFRLVIYNFILKAIFRLPFQFIFCYYFVYILLPNYILKRKFTEAVWYLVVSLFLLYWLTYFFLTPLFSMLNVYIYGKPLSRFIRFFFSFYSNINFTGPIPACSFMLIIKYYKNWYTKQSESQTLLHENTQAELQLLKAQVHPHFLFNTLNNIYSFALTEHPYAANLVDKLSGMIDYMRTEGERSLVLLEKEIQLLKDYIELEKVRYGNRLNMVVDVQGDLKGKLIAPLLMIPFVENCFKHGASKIRGTQWIKLAITVTDEHLHFSLSNSKPAEEIISGNKKGIGLNNVKKRLQLLYPANHILKIESTDETFYVHLQIAFQEKETIAAVNNSSIVLETKKKYLLCLVKK